jgi:hypothetical protein
VVVSGRSTSGVSAVIGAFGWREEVAKAVRQESSEANHHRDREIHK